MGNEKSLIREVIVGLGLGILTNLIWVLISDKLNPFLIIAIFIASVIVYYVLWNYLIKPILMVQKLKLKNVYQNYETAKSDIKKKMQVSSKIKVITIGGSTIAEDDKGEILDIITKRTKAENVEIRILLSNPKSSGLRERWQELEKLRPGDYDPEILTNSVLANVQKIKSRSSLIELRLYDSKPVWKLFILDELAYVSNYLSDKEGHDSEIIVFEKGSNFFRAYERLFDVIWRESHETVKES
jgi:hypothetical protein